MAPQNFVDFGPPPVTARWLNSVDQMLIAFLAGQITPAQFTAVAPGIVPASGGGATNFLRADGVWAAPAGGGGNITADTHPLSPTIYDDEFEFGSSLDTTGSRFSGANAWTNAMQAGSTNSVASGSLLLFSPSAANITSAIYQVPPAGTWKYGAKVNAFNAPNGPGSITAGITLWVGIPGGKMLTFGISAASTGVYLVQRWTNYTTFSATQLITGSIAEDTVPGPAVASFYTTVGFRYIQMEYDGTNINCYSSMTGIPGTFVKCYTETTAAFIGATPTAVGLQVQSSSATAGSAGGCVDWFRRIS